MIRRDLSIYENAAAAPKDNDGVTGQPGRVTTANTEGRHALPHGATPYAVTDAADPLATVRPLDFTATDGGPEIDWLALGCWILLPTREGK